METKEKFLSLLSDFITKKSVSTDTQYKSEIDATAQWLSNLFKENRFTVDMIEGYENPIVIASYIVDPSYETCLIYGHYDVQPAVLADGWDSEPFALTERNGRLYARGAIDNKGQVMIHIANVLELIDEGKLGYNVKFMIEGNEETGSPSLEQFIKDKKELLKCDFAIISDGEVVSGNPTLELGFRGGFNTTLTVKTSTTDLHSGIYGGATPSSSTVLAKFLASLHDEKGRVTIDGFYNDVDSIDEQTVENNKRIPFSLEEYIKLSGTKALLPADGYDFNTQVGLMPAIIITGIMSGYNGEGYRNSIPAKSSAKVNFRLVKNQVPEEICELYKKYVKENLPEYVDYDLEISDPYDGVRLSVDNKYIEKAKELMTEAYGKEPIFKYSGGGLPIVTYFDQVLGIPQVLAPLANEDCAMHAANENFEMRHVENALKFSRAFFEK